MVLNQLHPSEYDSSNGVRFLKYRRGRIPIIEVEKPGAGARVAARGDRHLLPGSDSIGRSFFFTFDSRIGSLKILKLRFRVPVNAPGFGIHLPPAFRNSAGQQNGGGRYFGASSILERHPKCLCLDTLWD